MLKYFAVAAFLVAAAFAQNNASSISIYTCPTSNCQGCQLTGTIPQRQCIQLNNGQSQKAHCVNLPKSRCIRQSLYNGPICNQTSLLLDTTRRCGVCEPAPEGWGVIDCSTNDVVYRYGCDARCGNCSKKISARVGKCDRFSNQGQNITFSINAIVSCKSLIYYQNYADSQCMTPQGNLSTAIAGMECLGYESNGQGIGAVEYQCNDGSSSSSSPRAGRLMKKSGQGIRSM